MLKNILIDTVTGHNCDVAVLNSAFQDFLQKILLQNNRSYKHEKTKQMKANQFRQ